MDTDVNNCSLIIKRIKKLNPKTTKLIIKVPTIIIIKEYGTFIIEL